MRKNNSIFSFKELKKHWETNSIICLIIVSAYMVGVFTGSTNWNNIYSGYYSTEPVYNKEPVFAAKEVDTLDTDITGNPIDGFNFTGRVMETSAPITNFECSVDGGVYGPCQNYKGKDLETLEVRAVNGTEVDHTPAAWIRGGL